MASKLTSSLRKSISAEKQSVEDKQSGSVDGAVITPKVVAKPSVAKVNTPRKSAPRKTTPKAAVAVDKPVSENVKASVNSVKPTVEKLKDEKSTAKNTTNSAAQPNIDSVKLILEKINNSSLELSNSFVENFMGINQDFSNYLQQISEVGNLAKVQEVNEKFLDNLRKRQQELIKKNMELLNSFKLV